VAGNAAAVAFLIRRDWQSKPGGDTVQLSLTRQALQRRGIASIVLGNVADLNQHDAAPGVLHRFNLERPADALLLIAAAQKKWPGVPLVVSTIHHREKWIAEILRASPAWRDRMVVAAKDMSGERGVHAAKEFLRRGGGSFSERLAAARMTSMSDLTAQKRELLGRADALIALGRAELEWLVEDLGVDRGAKAAFIVPNGFDFLPAPREGARREGIIQVSRIEPRKNQFMLARLARRHRLPITFVGGINENYAAYARAVAKEIAANPRARWLGAVARQDLPAILAGHSVHVLPSQAEVLPLVDFEALACGCAVFTTTRSCSPEYLAQATAQRNWTAADPDALTADAIEAFLQQQDGASAVEVAGNSLPTWDDVAVRIHDIYRGLMESSPGIS
jgi:glycosyltransferase involved in cell wall biosynthesis